MSTNRTVENLNVRDLELQAAELIEAATAKLREAKRARDKALEALEGGDDDLAFERADTEATETESWWEEAGYLAGRIREGAPR